MSEESIGGRFVLLAEAASGAGGTVYRARDLHTGEAVALKVLHGRGPDEIERFAREAALCARLRHPAMVRYVAHGVIPGGPPWLALEWIEGPTLAERLSGLAPSERLGLDETLVLVRRLAEALGEAHRAGVVHRDVKPANILLEGGSVARARLSDFGVATAAGQRAGLAAGSFGTMAPEQERGEEVDARADVFALGRLLARCLDGRTGPPALGALLARMLAPEPEGRPADAGEVVAALEAIGRPARLRDELQLVSVMCADDGGAPVVLVGADGPRRALELARRHSSAGQTVVVRSARGPTEELVALAARELAAAPPGGLTLDETTAGLLDAAAGDVRTVLGRRPPLVGRDLELGVLEGSLRDCVEGPAAAVLLLEGQAGAGKSRLLAELLARARQLSPDAAVLQARGDPVGGGSPYALLAGALRRAAGIEGPERPEDRQAKLRVRFGGGVEARTVALLGELAGVPLGDEELQLLRSDAVLLGDATRAAWEDWLRAETARHPVLFVLDDLQWGDLTSLALLDHGLRVLGDAPLFVVAGARPEVQDVFPELFAGRGLHRLRLAPLTRRAAERLVKGLLPEVDDATLGRVVERAEGNPFFLEELVRQVAAGKGGELPETVLATVQARLGALAPEARRVLRAASVFGGAFTDAGVAALLADEGADTVARWLDHLAQREVVTRRGSGYDFTHELVREAAYATLPREDRAGAHRIAGEWLEWTGAGDAIVLAGHFERGGELERAAAWYRRGAEQALGGDDLEAAIARAELGIALVPDGEPLGGLLLVKAEALRWRGDLIAAERHASLAAERLIPGGASWFQALGERIDAAGALGGGDTVEEWSQVAAGAEPLPPARAAQVIALCRAAAQLYATGRQAVADATLALAEARAAAHVADALVAARLARVRASRALAAGDLTALAGLAAEARERARAAGDVRVACQLEIDVARARAGLGDLEGSKVLLHGALAAATRMGLTQVEARARLSLGEIALAQGDLPGARVLLARAAEAGKGQRDRRLEGAARGALARLALAEGDAAAAERESQAQMGLLGEQER